MIDWQLVWLAVIAIAVTVMTVVQIAVLLTLARSARQLGETVQQVRQEIRPLAEKVNRIADDAARAAALAVTQVERVDRALLTATQRVDQTLNVVQGALSNPSGRVRRWCRPSGRPCRCSAGRPSPATTAATRRKRCLSGDQMIDHHRPGW